MGFIDTLLSFLLTAVVILVGGALIWIVGSDPFGLTFQKSVSLMSIFVIASSGASVLNGMIKEISR